LRQFASVTEKSRHGTDGNFWDFNAQEILSKKSPLEEAGFFVL
jgi:hypothetical protein